MTAKSLIHLDQSIFNVPSFTLECGTELRDVPVAYKTWGQLNSTKDNVMIICHAFTGSADVEDWYEWPCNAIGYTSLILEKVGSADGPRKGV